MTVTELREVWVIRESATVLEIEMGGERYVLAPRSWIRSTALEMASKLSTPGAGADRVLAAAADYEAYLTGEKPEARPMSMAEQIDAAKEKALENIVHQGLPNAQ